MRPARALRSWSLARRLSLAGAIPLTACGPAPSVASSPPAVTPAPLPAVSAEPTRVFEPAAPPASASASSAASPSGDPVPGASSPFEPMSAVEIQSVVTRERTGARVQCWDEPRRQGSERRSTAKVTVTLTVQDGRVTRAEARDTGDPAAACVQAAVQSWAFPRHQPPTTFSFVLAFVGN